MTVVGLAGDWHGNTAWAMMSERAVLVRPVEADLMGLLDATRVALADCRAEEPVLADAARFWSALDRILGEARLSALIRTSESGLVMAATSEVPE